MARVTSPGVRFEVGSFVSQNHMWTLTAPSSTYDQSEWACSVLDSFPSSVTDPLSNIFVPDFATSIIPVISRIFPRAASAAHMIPFADSTAIESAIRNTSQSSVLRQVRELSIDHQIIYMILYQLINHDNVVRTLSKPKTKLDHVLKAGIIYCFSLGPSILSNIVRSTPPPFDLALIQSIFCAALFLGDGSILNGILSMDSRSLVNRSVLLGDSHYHPVEYSSLFGHIQATRTLLDHGGDLHWQLHRLFPNRSPGLRAQELNTEGRAQIIQLLIGRGLLIHPEHAVSQMERCDLEELKVLISHCLDSSFETFFVHQALPIVLLRQDWDDSFSSMISDIVERASPYQIGNQGLWDEVLSESLSSAVLRSHSSAVDLLLGMGAKPTVNCLISAARSNNQRMFKDFLKCGLDPNARKRQPFPNPNPRYLRDYDTEYYQNRFCTALGETVKNRSKEAFEILPAQEFTLKLACQPDGFVSALIAGCQIGDSNFIDQILPLQIFPGRLSDIEEAIQIAVEEKHLHIVEKLMAVGITPTIRCLELAINNQQLAVVKMLTNGMDLTSMIETDVHRGKIVPYTDGPSYSNAIIFGALRWGNQTAIEHILSLDYAIDALYQVWGKQFSDWNLVPGLHPRGHNAPWDLTPLSAAILKSNTIVVSNLMAHGARAVLFRSRLTSYRSPFWAESRSEQMILTPLTASAIKNNLPLVKELLRVGADPFDNSALFVCAVLDLPEISMALLHAFKNRYPNGAQSFGCDALYQVIRCKNAQLLRILANDINLTGPVVEDRRPLLPGYPQPVFSTAFTTPLGEAIRLHSEGNGADGMFELLLSLAKDHSAVVYRDSRCGNMTSLLSAIFLESLKTVQKLHQAGANISLPATGRITRTPLQAAAQVGSKDIVEYLLDQGADPNEPPSKRAGATALQLAAISGNINVALILLEAGADINAPPSSGEGRTAFEGATEHGRIEMMIFLVRNGANLLANSNEQYRRAIFLAEDNRQYAAKALADDLYTKVLASQGVSLIGVSDEWTGPDITSFEGFFP
jgi:ankyrin repeat protein